MVRSISCLRSGPCAILPRDQFAHREFSMKGKCRLVWISSPNLVSGFLQIFTFPKKRSRPNLFLETRRQINNRCPTSVNGSIGAGWSTCGPGQTRRCWQPCTKQSFSRQAPLVSIFGTATASQLARGYRFTYDRTEIL